MGNSFSKADLLLYGTSMGCVAWGTTSSAVQAYLWLCRPLLNVSWGFLFGGSIWACVMQGPILMKHFPKQQWAPIQGRAFNIFFKAATLSSAILYLCTARLAPRGSLLVKSSLLCWLASLLNSSYLVPRTTELSEEKLQRELLYNLGKDKEDRAEDLKQASGDKNLVLLRKRFGMMHGFSILCAYTALGALVPYVFV